MDFEMVEIFFVVLPGAAIILALIFSYRIQNSKISELKLARFKGRAQLGFDDLYEQGFRQDNINRKHFEELWNEVAENLGIPYGLLRPEDKFAVELSPVKLTGLWYFLGPGEDWSNEELEYAAIDRLHDYLGPESSEDESQLGEIKTLRDYITFFESKREIK